MYGMSMRPVPETWEQFCEYWDHMCHNVLEDNWAAREVLDQHLHPAEEQGGVGEDPQLREGQELASAVDFTIPHCVSGIEETIALLRSHRDEWLRAQAAAKE